MTQAPLLVDAAAGPHSTPRKASVLGRDDGIMAANSVRFALREATARQHAETEDAFSSFDLSRRDHYRAFLTAHAMVLPTLELSVTGKAWPDWQPRFPQLADDLAAMGAWLPAPMIAPAINEAAAWGVQYVIEGSRLGGTVLSRRIGNGLPSRYLSPPQDMSSRWRSFCEALDTQGGKSDAAWLEDACGSAVETFLMFRKAATLMAGEIT